MNASSVDAMMMKNKQIKGRWINRNIDRFIDVKKEKLLIF